MTDRYKQALRDIVRSHCGSPFLGGQELCEIAADALGDEVVDEIYAEPGFHHKDCTRHDDTIRDRVEAAVERAVRSILVVCNENDRHGQSGGYSVMTEERGYGDKGKAEVALEELVARVKAEVCGI